MACLADHGFYELPDAGFPQWVAPSAMSRRRFSRISPRRQTRKRSKMRYTDPPGDSGGATHENVCNFVRSYPFDHRTCCRRRRLWSGVPLYNFWRVRGRWLGHRRQGMERMPRNDTRASSLPTWLRLENSLSGLWADRQGLVVGPSVTCPFRCDKGAARRGADVRPDWQTLEPKVQRRPRDR
jgi:hypothetical protein